MGARAIVLKAEGDHFCAGLDLIEHHNEQRRPEEFKHVSLRWHESINKMEYGLKILKEVDFSFEPFEEYFMRFEADNNFLKGFINNELLIEVEDKSNQFENGMIGCIVENGTIISDEISIN